MDNPRTLSEQLQRELAELSFTPEQKRRLVRALQDKRQPRAVLPWLPCHLRRLGELWNTGWEIPLAPLVATTAVTAFLLLHSLLLLFQPSPAYHQLSFGPATLLVHTVTEGVSLL